MSIKEANVYSLMESYTVSINDTTHTLVSCATGNSIDFPDFIEKHPFFNKDIVRVGNNNFEIVSSPVREALELPGVLKLDDRCKYGKDAGRFLYKCIPDDPNLPPFLVPRKESKTSFSNKRDNLLVLFRFSEWADAKTFPRATLVRTIGPSSNAEAFYEYQVARHGLHASISNLGKLAVSSAKGYLGPIVGEDRTCRNVITIDPSDCKDFDDAIEAQYNGSCYLLSVYIANVPRLMEALGLWSAMTERVATIYMPDRKWPMLPPLISERLASLVKGERRSAFAMDVKISNDFEIEKVEFVETIIRVGENYTYESDELLADPSYQVLCDLTRGLASHPACGPPLVGKFDSHDVVARLMVLMNHQASLVLLQRGKGIFRSVSKCLVHGRPDNVPDELMNKIAIWRGMSGSYVRAEANIRHEALDLDSYLHITSPIRRLVDVINMIELCRCVGSGDEFPDANLIMDRWMNSLDLLNIRMKLIQRAQSDSAAYNYCLLRREHECMLEGYAFECKMKKDGFFRYKVYVPVLNTVLSVNVTEPVKELTCLQLKVTIFDDEITLSRKLRVSIF